MKSLSWMHQVVDVFSLNKGLIMSNIVPFQDMQSMATAIAKSGLFGMKNESEVLAFMAVAQAEGLHPATAARDFHIIQGRPALKADAMLARFQSAGGKVEWLEYTDERVSGQFTHPNGGSLAVTWTIDQARSIGLVKPGSGWQKFPRAMLRSRCISEGIRSVYPGSVTGFYSPEEVQDFEPPKSKHLGRLEPNPVPSITQDVESVSEAVLDDLEVIESQPEKTIPMFVPNMDAPYGYYATVEDWIYAFAEMCERIGNSSKYSATDKREKAKALARANEGYMETFSVAQRMIINQAIANCGGQNG
jgi:hypothetical protein